MLARLFRKRVQRGPLLGLFVLFFIYHAAFAQTTDDPSTAKAKQEVESSPISILGSEYQNGIKLMQNRFRIDYMVDEITMIFFREYGSSPIVLVRPDGSKIFQSDADGTDLFWFDAATYDMISLKKPTPGPWQAIGQIIPNSRVMVISDIALHADPLPKIIFSGEILKQTAYLTNHGKPIDYREFRDVVELNIEFISTNNPNFNNFGAQTQNIASFEDNGKGMDERPLDGIFTGQFNLSVADGEWSPVFSVSTPMFTREQVADNLMLYPNPIKISVEKDEIGKGYHKLLIDTERELVDLSTLLVDGKIRFPNGDIQNFSITDMSDNVREYEIVNYESGVYRVKLTAYGNTVEGREFILDVPEFSFLVEEPKPVVELSDVTTTPIDTEGQVAEELGQNAELNANIDDKTDVMTTAEIDESEQGWQKSTVILFVIGLNLLIVIVGAGAIWYFTRRRSNGGLSKELKLD
ncbi:TIGR03503 family protein [Paraglaciecola sp. 25GB23A]|uniref:TIGR03503 family protein n=1 Tax=Paraglaciecola sp. 25GB23A TaxID=3156068 RepID=UPI0032AFBC99